MTVLPLPKINHFFSQTTNSTVLAEHLIVIARKYFPIELAQLCQPFELHFNFLQDDIQIHY